MPPRLYITADDDEFEPTLLQHFDEEGFHVTHTYASRCMDIGLVLAMGDKIGWHRTTAATPTFLAHLSFNLPHQWLGE